MGAIVGLKKNLRLTEAITIIVGSMIGSGILLLPAKMLYNISSPILVLSIFVLAAIFTILGALTFAELGSMYPKAGGQYHFLKEGLGRFWSYLFGWAMFWVIMAGIIAAVAVAIPRFLFYFFPEVAAYSKSVEFDVVISGTTLFTVPGWPAAFVSIGCILGLGFINYFGVKHGGILSNVSTLAKSIGLVGLVIVIAIFGKPAAGAFTPLAPTQGGADALVGFGAAVALVMFAFDGWPQATYMAGEMRNPKKDLPKALIIGPLITAAIYFLLTTAYFYVVPNETTLALGEGTLTGTLATAAAQFAVGDVGGRFIAAVALISVIGTVNAYVMTAPRVFYALAKDGALLPGMKKLSKNGTPAFALYLICIWSSILVMSGAYEQIVVMAVFGLWLFYIPTGIAHMRLRKTQPDLPRPYKTPWYPLVPILFMLAAVYIVVFSLLHPDSRIQSILALVLMALGIPFYFSQKNNKADADDSAA